MGIYINYIQAIEQTIYELYMLKIDLWRTYQ